MPKAMQWPDTARTWTHAERSHRDFEFGTGVGADPVRTGFRGDLGLVTDVVIADGGSRDETAMVADVAGCQFHGAWRSTRRTVEGGDCRDARALDHVLRPGAVLDTPWIGEVRRFIEQTPPNGQRCSGVARHCSRRCAR